jgi:hypothetical protein
MDVIYVDRRVTGGGLCDGFSPFASKYFLSRCCRKTFDIRERTTHVNLEVAVIVIDDNMW